MEVNVSDLPCIVLPDRSINRSTDKSSSASRDSLDNNEGPTGTDSPEESPGTPKPQPMAFTIDFGSGKSMDKSRLEHLAKQSQARHQRVQSMSASLNRPSPPSVPLQKPPMSAKLPRKAQGYNSEGYFSSDQEDSILSGSVKLKQSPLAQSNEGKPNFATSPVFDQSRLKVKSPTGSITKIKSKSPIVDSIMSRSDTMPSRQSLILPLKNTNTGSYADIHSPNYSTLSSSYQSRHLNSIMDQSPDGIMLTDISSPELDILTPDNVLSSPEHKRSPKKQKEVPDLFKKCTTKNELEILEDADMHSENSSTGTYTIEGDNYTEEQKARMSIDRTFGVDLLKESISEALERRSISKERDPELVLETERNAKDFRPRDICLRSPNALRKTFEAPKVSTEKNVLEISCCYESPTEDLATQTSKQIKSTRNYLEKIKNRVRTISEKTFQKSPPRTNPQDEGSFTSVTTSGVLAKQELVKPAPRRLSLSQSQIDRTEYVHRLSRESSVPVSLVGDQNEGTPVFESSVMRNAQAKTLCDDSGICDVTPEQIVGKLSYLSLNRCRGDKTWIQEWADSVKKYNKDTLSKNPVDLNGTFAVGGTDCKPNSPRHMQQVKSTPVRTLCSGPSKIPSPVSSVYHTPRAATDTSPDTESYLVRTQNAISNLQAKLNNRSSPISNIPPQLTSSLISERTAASRLPVSQLSRSNSLNYRLKRKDNTVDNSPLRSPGHYVITGCGIPASAKLLTSRSLDSDSRVHGKLDSNMNSPNSERTNSSDDKTLSNRPYDVASSPHRKTHSRHKSFDGRTPLECFTECDNANTKVSLKTVLKNNAFEAHHAYNTRVIEPTGCLGDGAKRNHARVYSDGNKPRNVSALPFTSSIRRSSSFNTVNRNNNYIDPQRAFRPPDKTDYKDVDYLSDESDNVSYPEVRQQPEVRYNRTLALRRDRLESPELKGIVPSNSPRCPNTPEMGRKFGPGLVRAAGRVANKERGVNRLSEPREKERERERAPSQQRISDTTRQAIVSRLTSRSSTRETQPKKQEKAAGKKVNQHRSATSLAGAREQGLSNWRKRASYDPMKAAREGRRRGQGAPSPANSSPVHRSQSFHSTDLASLHLDYSSEETEDDQRAPAQPERAMATSTHSEAGARARPREYRETLRRDYLAQFHVNQPSEKVTLRREDKRKTFIIDNATPAGDANDMENTFTIDNGRGDEKPKDKKDKRKTFILDEDCNAEKRKTFILDSDTNSTTNGSSPRNSSIFSHEKNSLTTGTSDTEGESGTESAPVVMRNNGRKGTETQSVKRHSGDYSASSSTSGARRVLPRYLDISKYKSETSPKSFLRRDPSKTYVGVLHQDERPSRGSARQHEMEQKKAELEKWKRRASYDPRKSAALAKTSKTPAKTTSVLRSQSFHGPVLGSGMSRYAAPTQHIPESYDDYTSDNDF